MNQSEIEAVAREVYRRTREFYATIEPRLGRAAEFGYRILYAPPVVRPPALILGPHPSGATDDPAHSDERDKWPEVNDYVEAEWDFATRLREIFSREFLAHCTGSNESFFRRPDADEYSRIVRETTGNPQIELC